MTEIKRRLEDDVLIQQKRDLFEEAKRWWDNCGKDILRRNRERNDND